jgi:predicted nicotinamide N-methyase
MASKPPTFVRQVLVRSTSLEIKQCYIGDVGCVVWDAALVLTKFLENKFYFSNEYWKDKYVLELGAGTGIVGLATASLGANAVLTDLPELVELMETNIRANSDCFSHLPKAMPLVWGQDISEFLPHPDVILMADLIYYEESVSKLCKTVLELCGPHTVVLMCYEERDIGNKVGLQKDFNEVSSVFHME